MSDEVLTEKDVAWIENSAQDHFSYSGSLVRRAIRTIRDREQQAGRAWAALEDKTLHFDACFEALDTEWGNVEAQAKRIAELERPLKPGYWRHPTDGHIYQAFGAVGPWDQGLAGTEKTKHCYAMVEEYLEFSGLSEVAQPEEDEGDGKETRSVD